MSSEKSKVNIVDGKLILSLPDAETPVVWQMDINKAKSAAFTIGEDKKAKLFYLVLRDEEGKEQNIASFKDKDGAVAVLMETSEMLQSSHGKIKKDKSPVTADTSPQHDPKSEKLGAVLAVLLIILLLGVWVLSATMSRSVDTYGYQDETASSASPSSPNDTGVAVSADDFLNSR